MTGSQKPVVRIVDDDASVCRALQRLLRSAGLEAETYVSCQALLESPELGSSTCLIVDIRMQGMGGLELPEMLKARGLTVPIIFITGFDTPETREQAHRAGASAYFRKPVDDQALIDAIQWAMAGNKPVS